MSEKKNEFEVYDVVVAKWFCNKTKEMFLYDGIISEIEGDDTVNVTFVKPERIHETERTNWSFDVDNVYKKHTTIYFTPLLMSEDKPLGFPRKEPYTCSSGTILNDLIKKE